LSLRFGFRDQTSVRRANQLESKPGLTSRVSDKASHPCPVDCELCVVNFLVNASYRECLARISVECATRLASTAPSASCSLPLPAVEHAASLRFAAIVKLGMHVRAEHRATDIGMNNIILASLQRLCRCCTLKHVHACFACDDCVRTAIEERQKPNCLWRRAQKREDGQL
jgi:hypothetical protein